MNHKELQGEREVFDLRVPQSTLHSGKIPPYVGRDLSSPEVLTSSLKKLLSTPTFPMTQIQLWQKGQDAFEAFVKQVFVKQVSVKEVANFETRPLKMAAWIPTSVETLENLEIVALPRDPADWSRELFETCDFALIQNPMLWDGYYLPDQILQSALARLHEWNPSLPLFVDQRSLVFSWEDLSPGDALQMAIANPHTVLNSTKPALAPHLGGEMAWTHTNFDLEAPESDFSAAALAECLYVVSSFKTKQGPYAAEFQKVMLVVKESLKRLSVELQRLSLAHQFRVTHWPSGGLYLRLECADEIAAARLQKTFKSHGILLQNAAPYGDPRALLLSYSMHLSQCDRLLKRLSTVICRKLL